MGSERIEEYLEAIYKRQGKETPVSTSSLAKDLRVSQPAVTDMLGSLESKGLIDYEASKGAVLTDLGMQEALGVIRRHRLWERFLTDILGMKWDKVHEEACKLEHVTSPDIEEKLAGILGDAETCPHGQSIPDKSLNVKEQETEPLSKFKLLQKVCIVAIDDEDSKTLQTIEELGLRPKVIVTILKKDEDGSLELGTGNEKIRLSSELAKVLMAKPVRTREAADTEDELPLSKLTAGNSGILKSYQGGRGMLGRCLSLGFTPGSLIKMLENYNGGPVLVKIHDTEVALGRELAEKITVTKNEIT